MKFDAMSLAAREYKNRRVAKSRAERERKKSSLETFPFSSKKKLLLQSSLPRRQSVARRDAEISSARTGVRAGSGVSPRSVGGERHHLRTDYGSRIPWQSDVLSTRSRLPPQPNYNPGNRYLRGPSSTNPVTWRRKAAGSLEDVMSNRMPSSGREYPLYGGLMRPSEALMRSYWNMSDELRADYKKHKKAFDSVITPVKSGYDRARSLYLKFVRNGALRPVAGPHDEL